MVKEIQCTQKNYVVKGTNTLATFTRPQYSKCELCRNIGKVFDYINKEMFNHG